MDDSVQSGAGGAARINTSERSALTLVVWGLVVKIAVVLIYGFLWSRVVSKLQGGGFDIDETEELIEGLQLYSKLFPPLIVLSSIAIAMGLLSLARSPRLRQGALLALAAVGLMLSAGADGWLWLAEIRESYPSPDTFELLYLIDVTAGAVALACLAVALVNTGKRLGASLPGGILAAALPFILWPALFAIYRLKSEDGAAMGVWLEFFLSQVMWALGAGWVLFFVTRVRGNSRALTQATAPSSLGADWLPAADGLRLYADGITWRVLITVSGYVLLLFAVLGRSPGMAKLVAWVLPIAAIVTSIMMVVGISKYARQPEHSPARAPAWVAFAAMLIALLLELYGFVLTLQVLGIDSSSWEAVDRARDLAGQAQTLSMWGMGLGFLALVLLLVSFGKLIHYIGEGMLFGRLVGVSVALVVMAVAVLAVRSYLTDARVSLGTGLTLAILIIAFALVTIMSYVSLTRALERALRARTSDGSELPVARVL